MAGVTRDEVGREGLRRRYWDEGKSCVEIGSELGRDPTTVRLWMVHFGIPTRPRGSNEAVHFKKGEPSTFAGKKHSPETRELIRSQSLADGRVPYLRAGKHWLKTVPKWEHPKWKGGITPERQAFYATEEWKTVAAAVWERAGGCCERCKVHQSERRSRFHIHHLSGFGIVALRAVLENLALLCRQCHGFVHSRGNAAREFLTDES